MMALRETKSCFQDRMKLAAPAFAEAASRSQAQGGASGKCIFHYSVGFTPRLPAAGRQGGASNRLARGLTVDRY